MPKGTIRGLNERGYGFIKTEDETDLFFHRNALEGVEFEKGQGRDGRPAAVKVRLIEIQVGDDGGDGGEEQ
jgi:cold shock CspA family protein